MGLSPGDHILIVCDGTDGTDGASEAASDPVASGAPAAGRAPLVNGVKRTIESLERELRARYRVTVLHPYLRRAGQRLFHTLPLPGYPEFEIATNPVRQTVSLIRRLRPDAIFNATTEGPLGLTTAFAARLLGRCLPREVTSITHTASYHTNLDDYAARYIAAAARSRLRVPLRITPRLFRPLIRFVFGGAHRILVPTRSVQHKLNDIGLRNTVLWPRGVDSVRFRPLRPGEPNAFHRTAWHRAAPRPVLLYFGRVAIEKGIDDFMALPLPDYHKVVLGDGPQRQALQARYGHQPGVHFLGAAHGEHLAHLVRSADVVVFPSKTDTFGNVLTEAGASGVPVVAYDVASPNDVVRPGVTGVLVPEWRSLAEGIPAARALDRQRCAATVREAYSWSAAAGTLVDNLQPIRWAA